MNFKLVLSFIFLVLPVSAGFAQNDLQIKKKVSRTMPGMEQLQSAQLTPEMAKQLKEMTGGTATVYVKGSWMRTDTAMKTPKMTGGFETQTYSVVVQCDKQRLTTFDTKSKKYYQYSMSGGQTSPSAEKPAKTGGYITVSGSVTDTGERAKLFGFDARRLKQTIIFTPSANACQKQKFQMEIDGWYADIPEFSCPLQMALPEEKSGSDCIDDLDYQVKGAVTGIALKEIKKINIDGQMMTTEEEATEVSRTTLAESFFEPPAGYKAAKTVSAFSDNSSKTTETDISMTTTSSAATPGGSTALPLPTAGIEQPVGEKKPGIIRVGIAKPKVTTPESKKDPGAGADIADAVTKSLIESLKAENVEAVRLETDFPENEAKEKICDYIFYADVTQKRGGGGMFGKMLAMGAASMAGAMVPGVGGMIASTVASQVMGQTMGKAAQAKDEFTLDYKVLTPDKTVLSQAVTKNKAEKDGEDVLTPQLQNAVKTVLDEIARKKSVASP